MRRVFRFWGFTAVTLLSLAVARVATAQPWKPNVATMAAPSAIPVVRVAVFGTDDRKPLPDRLKPLRGGIGLIYNERARTVCTAFCVAENIVATASHCIYRTKGETPPPLSRFIFTRPGTRYPAARIAGASERAAAQHILAGASGISTKPPIEAANDWALVKLDRPVCRGQELNVQTLSREDIAQASEQDRLFQVGFHRDYENWVLAHSTSCRAGLDMDGSNGRDTARDFRDPAHVILHTCDTGHASSGSPLLLETINGPVVIAINVGTFVRSRVLHEDGVVLRRLPATPVANTAASAEAFAAKLAILRSASILRSAVEVRALQGTLSALKLYQGPIDGVYSAKLRGAIHEFEVQNGAPATGLPTSALLKQLNEMGGNRLRPTLSP